MLLAVARKIAAHTRRLKQYGDKKKDYLRQPAATISVATSTHPLNKKKIALFDRNFTQIQRKLQRKLLSEKAANRILL